MPVDKFAYKIIKEDNNVRVYDSATGRNFDGKDMIYTYNESIDSLDWKITQDTIHFGGNICQRADLSYGGRKWIGWFALDIPIFDGPYKFAGLPGLIVKLADDAGFWTFELISLETTSIKHAINFQGWYVIAKKSKKDLYRDRRDFQNNLPIWNADAKPENPADVEKVKESYKKLIKDLKKDNHWIELYP